MWPSPVWKAVQTEDIRIRLSQCLCFFTSMNDDVACPRRQCDFCTNYKLQNGRLVQRSRTATCVREVPVSKPCRYTILNESFGPFPQSLQADTGIFDQAKTTFFRIPTHFSFNSHLAIAANCFPYFICHISFVTYGWLAYHVNVVHSREIIAAEIEK